MHSSSAWSWGAHFLSHDLWSAFLVWVICTCVYRFGYRAAFSITRRAATALRDGDALKPPPAGRARASAG